MQIPAGHHIIDFKFEPKSYKTGYTMATWGGILLYLFLIGGIAMSIRKKELAYPWNNLEDKNAKL